MHLCMWPQNRPCASLQKMPAPSPGSPSLLKPPLPVPLSLFPPSTAIGCLGFTDEIHRHLSIFFQFLAPTTLPPCCASAKLARAVHLHQSCPEAIAFLTAYCRHHRDHVIVARPFGAPDTLERWTCCRSMPPSSPSPMTAASVPPLI